MESTIKGLVEVEEYQEFINLHIRASNYLQSHDWCKSIINSWHDQSISSYDIVGVFLFQIEPIDETVDDFIWIINGDIPSVYLDKQVKTGIEALTIYCDLMTEWASNVKFNKSIEDCYPVDAQATSENADLLIQRIDFIKQNFL